MRDLRGLARCTAHEVISERVLLKSAEIGPDGPQGDQLLCRGAASANARKRREIDPESRESRGSQRTQASRIRKFFVTLLLYEPLF